MKHTEDKQPEGYEKKSLTMLEKPENLTWLNKVWTQVIQRYVRKTFRLKQRGLTIASSREKYAKHCSYKNIDQH